MMKLLTIRCLWEYVDPSGLIFSLAFVHGRVGVSGYYAYDHFIEIQSRGVADISCK